MRSPPASCSTGRALSRLRDRYRRLADWVLPSADHPVVRLEGDFTPSFPAPSFETDHPRRTGAPPANRRRDPRPAIELVETARAIGKLDELAARVESISVDDGAEARRRSRGLIAVARGDDTAAAKILQEAAPLLAQRPIDLEEWQRWPELCLADRALAPPRAPQAGIGLGRRDVGPDRDQAASGSRCHARARGVDAAGQASASPARCPGTG